MDYYRFNCWNRFAGPFCEKVSVCKQCMHAQVIKLPKKIGHWGVCMRCEFEEKEYEQPLNYELGKQNVWSPGQVFESIVGFDAAIISNNPEFWKLWQTRGLSLGRQGIHLDWQIWEMVEERWKSKTFPKLKFNLFVQHKVACMLRLPRIFWRNIPRKTRNQKLPQTKRWLGDI